MKQSKNSRIFELYFRYNIFLKIFYLFQMIKPILNKCDKNTPILLQNGSCVLQYCTDKEYKEKKCKIDNDIIKTQWLNNIIWIGDKDFRYINFASFSNGDMILETTSIPGNSKRMFYGVKKNGRALFKNKTENKMTKFYYLEAKNQTENEGNIRYEAEIFISTINGGDYNGKEYLVSVGKGARYAELYDFDNDKIYQTKTYDFLKSKMDNSRSGVINFKSNNTYYSIFSFITSSLSLFNIKKLKFISLDIKENNPIINYNYRSGIGKTTSCYITDLKYIVCFLIYESKTSVNTKVYGYIIILDENLNDISSSKDIYSIHKDSTTFFKCIHFKEEIGIFIYHYYTYDSSNNAICNQFPKILVLNYNISNQKFEEYTDIIILDQRKLNLDYLLNDIIKISDNKVCLISTSDSREMLYIIIINIFESENVVIRYYDINIFKL